MALARRLQHPPQRRPRRPRAGVGAEGPARRHHCAQQRRLAPLRREIGDGHRSPAQHLIEPLAPEPADVLPQAQQVPQLRRRRPIDRRRHQAHQPIEHARDVVGRCLELRPALGVLRRPGRQRLRRLRADRARGSARGHPSDGAKIVVSGRTTCSPCCSRPRSRAMSSRTTPACASAGARNPGWISCVTAQPPTSLRFSSTSGLWPARAR